MPIIGERFPQQQQRKSKVFDSSPLFDRGRSEKTHKQLRIKKFIIQVSKLTTVLKSGGKIGTSLQKLDMVKLKQNRPHQEQHGYGAETLHGPADDLDDADQENGTFGALSFA